MKQDDKTELTFYNIWDDEITKKIEIPVERKSSFCEHLWLSYTGLNEVYQYCKYCNIKSTDI